MKQQFLNWIRRWVSGIVSEEIQQLLSDTAALQARISALEMNLTALQSCTNSLQESLMDHGDSIADLHALVKPSTRAAISVSDAIMAAAAEIGLPLEQINDQFDIARTGKLNDLIDRTRKNLGTDHPMRTIGDVMRLFS